MKDDPRVFKLQVRPGRFAVLRLEPDSRVPGWATSGDFFSVTRTDDELSIVCRQELAPSGVKCSADWSCLKLVGPFAFDEAGVVASVTTVIADADIGVFVISTFDGDHLLVKEADLRATVSALTASGHLVDEIPG